MRPAGMGMYDPEEAHIDYLVRKLITAPTMKDIKSG